MVREQYEQIVCDYNAPPSALWDFYEKFPFNPEMPWTGPEWAASYVRAEEEKARALRAVAREDKRRTNRKLYGRRTKMNDLIDAAGTEFH